ncbi:MULTISPECIES: hypothetical protein [unclassified Leucobacter]|uniref:hypothetical protein n=1 Tax=unclassified Leucobacter TaxID=2621730 RepID=UPI00165DF3BB|nr:MULTISPECIES: hypothetical protein [unclassified Leucobacter]MBC9927792.1 hypothetical protein [Leucobacter sp. cx-169]
MPQAIDDAAVTHTDSTWMNRHFELVIAMLLGLASIVTAWASFQASLYDGEMSAANTRAGVLSAEAESLYLEGNQQYLSDGQLFDRLTELRIQSTSADAAAAAVAAETIDVLTFQSMSEDFAAAVEWADAENEADPEMFTHPQGDEAYLATLFGEYEQVKAQADTELANSSKFNDLGDQLTLNTVLLAISLFLFGIAAILRTYRTRLLITGVSAVVMVVATVLTFIVVSTPIS